MKVQITENLVEILHLDIKRGDTFDVLGKKETYEVKRTANGECQFAPLTKYIIYVPSLGVKVSIPERYTQLIF